MSDTTEEHPAPELAAASDDTLRDLWRIALAHADAPHAETVTSAHEQAGKTIGKLTGTASPAVAARIQADAASIIAGRLDGVEGRLAAQAITLDTLFHHLAQFAHREPLTLEAYTGYLKLALRAQSQSAAALMALAEIKQGPRVVVTRQLNTASQQIVNNGVPQAPPLRRVRGTHSSPPALPEPTPTAIHAPMDTRSPRKTKQPHLPVAAVDPIHRPPH